MQQNETSHLKAIGLNVDVEQHKFSQVQYSLELHPAATIFSMTGLHGLDHYGVLWKHLTVSLSLLYLNSLFSS